MKAYILGCILSFTGLLTSAQVAMKGLVLDAEKKSIPFANILLLQSSDSSLIKTALTDTSGYFSFEKMAKGRYLISVSYIGMEKYFSPSFSITESTSFYQVPEIILQTAKSSVLGEAVITSQHKFIEMQNGNIVMNPESSPVSAGNTALDILRKAPGVTLDQNQNISLKGKQNVLVMIDDKPSYLTGDQLMNMLSNLPSNAVGSIEIINNPSAKYDASGNAGIINIKLKKLKRIGYNGILTAGAGYGWYEKYHGGINLNMRNEKLNVFGNYNYRHNIRGNNNLLNREVSYKSNTTSFNQHFLEKSGNDFQGIKTGIDYFAGPNTTLGVLVNGSYRSRDNTTDNKTSISGYNPNSYSDLFTANNNESFFHNITSNFNVVHTLDTNKRKISADADYSSFESREDGNLITHYYNNDTEINNPYQIKNKNRSAIEIMAVKADYEHPFKNEGKIEAGIKSSFVKIQSRIFAQILVNEIFIPDTTRNNDFNFNERIHASYLTYSRKIKKTGLNAGLRVEQTVNRGESVTLNKIVERDYISLFPSLSLSQQVNENNSFNFSYSRRIDRPDYDDLNPFIYYLDEYTFRKGNPFLNPQFTHGMSISHVYKQFLNTTAGVDLIMDHLGNIIAQNDSSKVTYITNTNYKKFNNYYLNISTEFPLNDWYTLSCNLTTFYNQFNIIQNGYNVINQQFTFEGNLTNIFKLKNDWAAEISAYYTSPSVYGLFKSNSRYSFDMGISKNIKKPNMNLKVSATDVLNTLGEKTIINDAGIILKYKGKWESRRVNVTLSYNFGKTDMKSARKRSTATEEEQKRMNN